MAHADSTKNGATITRQTECNRARKSKSIERQVADIAFRRLCKEVNGR